MGTPLAYTYFHLKCIYFLNIQLRNILLYSNIRILQNRQKRICLLLYIIYCWSYYVIFARRPSRIFPSYNIVIFIHVYVMCVGLTLVAHYIINITRVRGRLLYIRTQTAALWHVHNNNIVSCGGLTYCVYNIQVCIYRVHPVHVFCLKSIRIASNLRV